MCVTAYLTFKANQLVMKTVKVAMNLNQLSPLQKTAFADVVFKSMTGNTHFISPYPALSALNTANINLKAAITAAGLGTLQGVTDVHAKEIELMRVLRGIAGYVEFESNNSESIALTSGFDVKQPAARLAKTYNATQGLQSGTVVVETKYESNSSYIWEMCPDPIADLNWKQVAVTMQSKYTVIGLTPATKYWFRVAIVNKDGQQPYSDPHFVLVV
jgi:hypothetical protein